MTTGDRAGRTIATVTGWQVIASICYYALFASRALLRDAFGLSRFLVSVLVTLATLGYTLALFPVGAAVDGAPGSEWALPDLRGLQAYRAYVSLVGAGRVAAGSLADRIERNGGHAHASTTVLLGQAALGTGLLAVVRRQVAT